MGGATMVRRSGDLGRYRIRSGRGCRGDRDPELASHRPWEPRFLPPHDARFGPEAQADDFSRAFGTLGRRARSATSTAVGPSTTLGTRSISFHPSRRSGRSIAALTLQPDPTRARRLLRPAHGREPDDPAGGVSPQNRRSSSARPRARAARQEGRGRSPEVLGAMHQEREVRARSRHEEPLRLAGSG